MRQARFGAILYVVMIFPVTIKYLESMMVIHMLIQFPLLILVGWLLGTKIINKWTSFFSKWNRNGVPGIILVVFITTTGCFQEQWMNRYHCGILRCLSMLVFR